MLFNSFSENEYVVQVNHHNPFSYELLEDVIHHGLESGWAIGETEEHYQWFEETSVRSESSLPLVTFFHLNIIETPSDVQFGEVLGAPELSDQFGNEQEWVLVFDHYHIKGSVVLDKLEASIFLFDEEDWGHHQGFRGLDMSRF